MLNFLKCYVRGNDRKIFSSESIVPNTKKKFFNILRDVHLKKIDLTQNTGISAIFDHYLYLIYSRNNLLCVSIEKRFYLGHTLIK